MIPPGGQEIIEMVAQGKYEEALGVALNAARQRINEAHLRLSHRFRESTEVREALDKAKSVLVGEDDAAKDRRLSKIGRKEEALPYLEKAVKLRGDALDYHWLGRCF